MVAVATDHILITTPYYLEDTLSGMDIIALLIVFALLVRNTLDLLGSALGLVLIAC